ncbi:hypothetical protein JXA88_03350 [Candidatus Fermentibacteria bacterium]|nr:hypothetical protein [Candidatus Fermentibacteria bacterium]
MKPRTVAAILALLSTPAVARMAATVPGGAGQRAPSADDPAREQKTHMVGNIWLTISNFGFFGNDEQTDVRGTEQWLPKCEFPGGSGIDYLFQGAMWIGGVVDNDTLVSVGADGWQHENEMFPCTYKAIPCLIDSLSISSSDSLIAVRAVSEQDYVAVYADTFTSETYDKVPTSHMPMGIEVTQRSYSWSYSYAEDFVLFDFSVKNIRNDNKTIRDVYLGVYIDADCVGPNTDIHDGAQDDVTGFAEKTVDVFGDSITINLAWISDYYGSDNTSGVSGVRIVRTPNPDLRVSYNWWLSDTNTQRDWGPRVVTDPTDVGGTPDGDAAKYRIMSNGYFDPNQVEVADQIPAGTPYEDTRYLLSFGPFDIDPGDTLPVTLAYVCGANFVRSPGVFNFLDVAANAVWAARVYDIPGIDTDGDGYRGEFRIVNEDTIWVEGDGIPDFRGPPPPSAPKVMAVPGKNRVTLHWSSDSELSIDPFTQLEDFAGYRIYRSRYGTLESSTLLYEWAQNPDVVDYEPEWPPPPYQGSPGDAYAYTYVDEGLTALYPYYYSVVAFDMGDERSGLGPLESSVLKHYLELGPIFPGANEFGTDSDLAVRVVPNPYRIDADYEGLQWEAYDPKVRWSEHTRRIDFINLAPGTATIRIYTLDGDLVDTVYHADESSPREPWDMINRNNQSIVSDIYLFSVEYTSGPKKGSIEVGKFVVLK